MEKELKVYIIDDEEAPRKLLRYLLDKHLPYLIVVGEANSLKSGVEDLKDKEIDILFLDIEMPEHKGLEILNFIPRPISFELIFITAYNDYAIKAFKLSAFDYLLKPLEIEELKASIERLLLKMKHEKGYKNEQLNVLDNNLKAATSRNYYLKTHREELVIPLDEIFYLEADGMYTSIFLKNEQLTVSKPLKEVLNELPDYFIRTHRSFAINLSNVISPLKISKDTVLLNEGFIVPLSSRRKSDVIKAFENFSLEAK